MLTPEIKELVTQTGILIQDKMIDTLISNNSLATGRLAKGIETSVTEDQNGITTTISIPFYGQFVDQGRRPGKMPPVEPIQEWIRAKRIKVPKYTQQQLGWAIAKSIAKKGTRPKPFIENSISFILNNFPQELTKAAGIDITNNINAIFEQSPNATVK